MYIIFFFIQFPQDTLVLTIINSIYSEEEEEEEKSVETLRVHLTFQNKKKERLILLKYLFPFAY